MKFLNVVSRILLGLIFLLSGLNSFIRFTHPPSFGTEIGRQFMSVMQATPYAHVLFAGQILCGLLLITGFFVPISLTVLAAYIFNIYMFHLFIDSEGIPVLIPITVLWTTTFLGYRSAFESLLRPRIVVRESHEAHHL